MGGCSGSCSELLHLETPGGCLVLLEVVATVMQRGQQRRTYELAGGRNHIKVPPGYLKDVLIHWVMTRKQEGEGARMLSEHCQYTLEQGTEPANAPTGPCAELAAHPGVDLGAYLRPACEPGRGRAALRTPTMEPASGLCDEALVICPTSSWPRSASSP